jgi:hypothetical protein
MIPRPCPGISCILVVNSREAVCSFPSITSAINCCRKYISVVSEPLPSYQQFLTVSFRGYESRIRCLATARLEHTHFLRYFGPLGRIPHFSLLILFLILIQSGITGKLNYTTIHGKIVMSEYTYINSLIYIYRLQLQI